MLAYSANTTALTYVVLLLAMVGTVLEFAALSVLIPLSRQINHSRSSAVSQVWETALRLFHIKPSVLIWLTLFLVLLLIRVVLQFAYSSLTSLVARNVTASLSTGAFKRFIGQTPLLEIQREQIGHFIAIAGDEANRAGQIFLYFSQLIVALLSVAVTIAAMLIFSALLAAAVGVFIFLTGLAISQSTRKIFRLGLVVKNESRIATSTFLDGLNGLRSIRSIGGESYVVGQYAEQILSYNRTLFRVDYLGHAQKSLPLIILLALVLAALLIAPANSMRGLNLAAALASMVLLMRFFPSAGACLSNGMKLIADLRASNDVIDVARPTARPVFQAQKALKATIQSIELSNLSFKYQDSAKPVLAGLNYKFVAGNNYAICGPSGSGKSTLVDLLLGLIPCGEGEIKVNGIPQEAIDPEDFRKRAVLVEQQSRIFNDTVRNNIVFGLSVSDDALKEAIRLAEFDQVVENLPLGLDTVIDYQGSNLSGGQKQRLGIARAILRKPEVLILDESTSALDAATRDVVLENILGHFGAGIVVVVTHDPAIIGRLQNKLTLNNPEQSPTAFRSGA